MGRPLFGRGEARVGDCREVGGEGGEVLGMLRINMVCQVKVGAERRKASQRRGVPSLALTAACRPDPK